MSEPITIILVTTDNHTLAIQSVASMIYNELNLAPIMYFLPYDLPEYPETIKQNIMTHIASMISNKRRVIMGFLIRELSKRRTFQIAREARTLDGNITLVAGGSYATAASSELLKIFDYVVIGDCKGLLRIINGSSSERVIIVPHMHFYYPLFSDNTFVLLRDGGIKKSRLRPLVHPQYKNKHGLELMASVGCSYSCSYCEVATLRNTFGVNYRIVFSEPTAIVNLIKRELKLNPDVKYVYFFDEDFLLKPINWLKDFTKSYREVSLPFFIFATPFSILRFPEKLDMLADVGLETVNMGIQSGSERITKGLFGRKESKSEVIEAVKILTSLATSSMASPPMLDFIILNPYETANDMKATIDLIRALPPPFNAVMHMMSFFKGTPLYAKALEDKRIPEGYEFKFDLHDFVSRVKTNELRIDYNQPKNIVWLFLNTVLYGMNGVHREVNGVRQLGGLSEKQLDDLLSSNIESFSYEDIVLLAESFPNPMDLSNSL
ncbi:MAG: radical SAM protein [Candidatus Bathyarchaeia archaeon]